MPKSESSLITLEGYHYRLIRRIRKTRMSEVWLAEETTTGQRVIIKFALIGEFTDPNQQAILNDERWLRCLNHPAIITLRPILENPPARDPVYRAKALNLPGMPWFIVEPYLAGGSVADVLEQHGKFDLATALRIAKHMFEVLVYLRQMGCVHNDMKLGNWVFAVKFDPAKPEGLMGQPILIDLGIAQGLDEKVIPAIAPGWSAPEVEQAYHAHTLITTDASWDVYGVALMLQAMITGQPKPDPDPAKRYTGLHLTRAALAAGDWVTEHNLNVMDDKLNHLLDRAINHAPFMRPTADEFVAELDALLQLIKPKPAWVHSIEPFFHSLIRREIKRAEPPARTPRVHRWASALAMTFLTLLLVLAAMFRQQIIQALPLSAQLPTLTPGAPVIIDKQIVSPTVSVNPLISATKGISNVVVATDATPAVTLEPPTATVTPLPPTATPVATATDTSTPTATFAPTPTALLTDKPTRVPATLIPTAIPTILVTATTAPPRPTLDQSAIILKSPLAGAAKNIDSTTKDREREDEFVWEYRSEFNRRGICAELVFNYPLHTQKGSNKTEVVADVTEQSRRKVDLPGWFHSKDVQQSGFTFRWGVRIFYCGSSERPVPAEWREYNLTQQ